MVTTVRSLLVLFVVVSLLAFAPAAGAVEVAGTAVDEDTSDSDASDLELDGTADTTDATEESLNETTDDVAESTNETTDTTDGSLNETADDVAEDTNETTDDPEEDLNGTSDSQDDSNETTDDVEDGLNDTVEGGEDDLNETVDETEGNLNETVDDIEDSLNETIDGTEDDLNETIDGIEDGLNETVDGIEDGLNETTDEIGENPNETLDGPTDIDETLTDIGARQGETPEGLHEIDGDGDGTTADTGDSLETDDGNDASAGTASGDRGRQSFDAGNATAPASATTDGDEAESTASPDDGDALPLPGGTTGSGMAFGAILAGAALLGRSAGTAAWLSAAGGSGGSLLATLASLLRVWASKFLALIGYKRYSDDDPLEHEGRRKLYEAIRSSPGSYLAEISDEAGVEKETARYHLRILEFENLVSHESIRGRRRYFPVDTEWAALEAALNDDATAAIIETLHSDGPDTVSGLADALDRDPSTISHHLDRLAEDGIVERERDGRAVTNRLTTGAVDALDEPTARTGARAPPPTD